MPYRTRHWCFNRCRPCRLRVGNGHIDRRLTIDRDRDAISAGPADDTRCHTNGASRVEQSVETIAARRHDNPGGRFAEECRLRAKRGRHLGDAFDVNGNTARRIEAALRHGDGHAAFRAVVRRFNQAFSNRMNDETLQCMLALTSPRLAAGPRRGRGGARDIRCRQARLDHPPSNTTAAPSDLNGRVIVFDASSSSPTTPITGVG